MSTRCVTEKFFLLILLGCLLLSCADMADEGKELAPKLQATLKGFARSNGLSDEKLQSLVGGLVLNSQAIGKGGVGSIGINETYVVLDPERNTVLISGNEWKGAKSTEREVVIVDDHGVLGSVIVQGESNLKVVLFSPNGVRYVDLSNNTGARYSRPKQVAGP